MLNTQNFEFLKPEQSDTYNVEHQNSNWDKVDSTLKMLIDHVDNMENPHKVDAEQIGLGEVDNTADENKPVSKPQKEALDALESELLVEINNVQSAVDTATSIAKGSNQGIAYENYAEMVRGLSTMESDELRRGQNIYIGTVGVPDLWIYSVEETSTTYLYSDDETFTTELQNNITVQVGFYKVAQLETQKVDLSEYLKSTGDTKNNIATFTSGDSASPTGWTNVSTLISGLSHANIFSRVSTMFKNVRWLYEMLGTTDISKIEDGTVTGILSALNTNMVPDYSNTITDTTHINENITITDNGYIRAYGRSDVNFRLALYINGYEVTNNMYIGNADYVQYSPFYKVNKGDIVVIGHSPETMFEVGVKINL